MMTIKPTYRPTLKELETLINYLQLEEDRLYTQEELLRSVDEQAAKNMLYQIQGFKRVKTIVEGLVTTKTND